MQSMKKDSYIRPIILCALLLLVLLAVLLLAGRTGTADGSDASAEAEMQASSDPSFTADAQALDLTTPERLPAGVSFENGTYTVTASGVYRLTGAMEGSLTVDADGPVELIFAGVNITGSDCVRLLSSDPVTITAEAGTENILSDSAASAEPAETDAETDASGSVVYSKAPLTIGGEGSLVIRAQVNNGLRCRDCVTVTGGSLDITAANHGLKVIGVFSVTGGSVNINAGANGLVAEDARLESGTVSLAGGNVSITAGNDGIRTTIADISGGAVAVDSVSDAIQAESEITVSGGQLSVTAGGGGGNAINHAGENFGPWSSASDTDDTSCKGLKSGGDIRITGGSIDLNTSDDTVHCAACFTMDGGHLTLLSGDDAIHADDMLVVNSGVIDIQDCFEGLEAYAIEVRGGSIDIRSVNDGINANGSEGFGGMGASNRFESLSGAERTYFLQSGGTIHLVVTGNMSNMGDGVDSNGYVYVTGGELIVSTFGTVMENGIDTGAGGPVVTGGKVIAGGSSTMAESFSSSSTQCCAVISTASTPSNTEVTLSDEDGNVLWIVTLEDSFSCLQISHPDMSVGHKYTLSYNGQTTTLDFTNSNLVNNTHGFGFGRPF